LGCCKIIFLKSLFDETEAEDDGDGEEAAARR